MKLPVIHFIGPSVLVQRYALFEMNRYAVKRALRGRVTLYGGRTSDSLFSALINEM